MGVNTKIINRRIKSIGNTKKITKAMEMVSAAKMRKAVEAAVNTRTYAKMAWDLLVKLSKVDREAVPLLDVRPVKNLLLILITSNRGLCGSFNSNIIRKTAAQLTDPKNIGRQRGVDRIIQPMEDMKVDVIGVGKKGAEFAKKMNYSLVAAYSDFSDTPELDDVMPMSRQIIADYEQGKYDKVVVAYTDFKSAISQVAKLRQVLPVAEHDLEKMILDLPNSSEGISSGVNPDDYIFEPNKNEVLKIILPRLVETQIYQAVLESAASEHSARMMAMRNASDAAKDMISQLTMAFNKARQGKITQEIAEIVGGAAALE